MGKRWDVVIIGSGNAALCAGIAACELGADVLMIEEAARNMPGGNTNYTAGAMRCSTSGRHAATATQHILALEALLKPAPHAGHVKG